MRELRSYLLTVFVLHYDSPFYLVFRFCPSLRNGMISTVCSNAPNEVKVQFSNLVRAKRLEKEDPKSVLESVNEGMSC